MLLCEGSRKSARVAVVTLLLALGLNAVMAIDLPPPMQRCQVDDEKCLKNMVLTYIKTYQMGIPEYKIPGIDPLQLGDIHVLNNGANSALSFNLKLSNTSLHKLSETLTLTSVKGLTKDLSKPMKLSWVLAAPALELHAHYDVNGKIMILPLVSKGEIIINLSEVQVKTRVTIVPQKREDGHYYLKISEFKSDSKVSSGHFTMSNLFNQNAALHDSTLPMLNKEWNTLSADIQPKIIDACDRVFESILQKLFDVFPYDAFFEI